MTITPEELDRMELWNKSDCGYGSPAPVTISQLIATIREQWAEIERLYEEIEDAEYEVIAAASRSF